MIVLQKSIALNLPGREVTATIDGETGLIGFTEVAAGKTITMHYINAPMEFKVALMEVFNGLPAGKQHVHVKITRKHPAAIRALSHLKQDQ